MEFIGADRLKQLYSVYGHLYNLSIAGEIFHCRSAAEIFICHELNR